MIPIEKQHRIHAKHNYSLVLKRLTLFVLENEHALEGAIQFSFLCSAQKGQNDGIFSATPLDICTTHVARCFTDGNKHNLTKQPMKHICRTLLRRWQQAQSDKEAYETPSYCSRHNTHCIETCNQCICGLTEHQGSGTQMHVH